MSDGEPGTPGEPGGPDATTGARRGSGTSGTSRTAPTTGIGDPWSIVAYLLSGMLVYGGGGWLLDRWLGTSFLALVGLLVGTALAVYLIYVRLG